MESLESGPDVSWLFWEQGSETKVLYGTALMELARPLVKDNHFKLAQQLLRAALQVRLCRITCAHTLACYSVLQYAKRLCYLTLD